MSCSLSFMLSGFEYASSDYCTTIVFICAQVIPFVLAELSSQLLEKVLHKKTTFGETKNIIQKIFRLPTRKRFYAHDIAMINPFAISSLLYSRQYLNANPLEKLCSYQRKVKKGEKYQIWIRTE